MKSLARAAAVAALALVTATAGHAAPTMAHGAMMHGKMAHSKMAHSTAVYVCKKCSMYYSPAQAKSMKYMDSMGHKLTKMSKVPAGYTMGGKMDKDKMGGKM